MHWTAFTITKKFSLRQVSGSTYPHPNNIHLFTTFNQSFCLGLPMVYVLQLQSRSMSRLSRSHGGNPVDKVEAIQNGHPYVSQNWEILSPFWKHIIALFHQFGSYISSVYTPSRHPRKHFAKKYHFEGENVEHFSIFKSAQNFNAINLPWLKKNQQEFGATFGGLCNT